MECCNIESKIGSFPETWRKELSLLLCEIINERVNIDCNIVKKCETITSISNLNLKEGSILEFSYFDETGKGNYRSIDLSEIISDQYNYINGLNLQDDLVKLGGNLIENTIINLNSYNLDLKGNNIIFSNYVNTRDDSNIIEPINFIYTDVNGNIKSSSLDFIYNLIPTLPDPLIFQNALNQSGNLVKWGGELIENTNVFGNYKTTFSNNTFVVRDDTEYPSSYRKTKFKLHSSGNTAFNLPNNGSNTDLLFEASSSLGNIFQIFEDGTIRLPSVSGYTTTQSNLILFRNGINSIIYDSNTHHLRPNDQGGGVIIQTSTNYWSNSNNPLNNLFKIDTNIGLNANHRVDQTNINVINNNTTYFESVLYGKTVSINSLTINNQTAPTRRLGLNAKIVFNDAVGSVVFKDGSHNNNSKQIIGYNADIAVADNNTYGSSTNSTVVGFNFEPTHPNLLTNNKKYIAFYSKMGSIIMENFDNKSFLRLPTHINTVSLPPSNLIGGELIYDTTTGCIKFYSEGGTSGGAGWRDLCSSGGGGGGTYDPCTNAFSNINNISGTYNWFVNLSETLKLTLTGNTLLNLTGLCNGRTYNFEVIQDGTGGRTLLLQDGTITLRTITYVGTIDTAPNKKTIGTLIVTDTNIYVFFNPVNPYDDITNIRFGIVSYSTAIDLTVINNSEETQIISQTNSYQVTIPKISNIIGNETELVKFYIAEPLTEPAKEASLIFRNITSPFLQEDINSGTTPLFISYIIGSYRVYEMKEDEAQNFNGSYYGIANLSTPSQVNVNF